MSQFTVENEVRAQHAKFERELNTLLLNHPGKWVVYLDGVQGTFDTEDEAYRFALKTYGMNRGPLVVRVEQVEPMLLHAAYVFNLGC